MPGENNKRSFGSLGEKIAADYLVKHGYKIITRNYRVGRFGEIDIIAREKEYICFIEVKTRTGTFFGMPSEAVNRKKQEVIARLASIYINQYGLYDSNPRFDIVEVLVGRKGGFVKVESINIIKNAF